MPQQTKDDGETPRAAGRGPIIGFYFLMFCATGVTLPFLPAYLKSLALSATQVGVLLAIGPCVALLAPPLWGHLADRTGRPDRVLSVLALGSAAFFLPLLGVQRFGALFAVLFVYALFSSSISTLVDTLALQRVALEGGNYSRLRIFGSLGFVVASTLFGLSVSRVDVSTVAVPLALLFLAALWSFTLKARTLPGFVKISPFAGLGLLRGAGLAPFLAAACIHWIACAPWNGSLAIHVTALGLPPSVVGLSAGLGVVAEMVAMLLYPRFSARIAPRHLLFISFALSAVRWAGMALVNSAFAIVALSLLHGFTFGAFYIAAVAFVARRVPESMRASGQALFVSITFGLGGLVGLITAGVGYDHFKGHWLFGVAAAVEGVAALIALGLKPPREAPTPGISRLAPSSHP
ncbi:MAG: MFS transporter [Myxococcaceae bacterium]